MLKRLMLLSLITVATVMGCATTLNLRQADYNNLAVGFNPTDSDWTVGNSFGKNELDEDVMVKVFTHFPTGTRVVGEYFPNSQAEPATMAEHDAELKHKKGYETSNVEKLLNGARYSFQQWPLRSMTVVYSRPRGRHIGLIKYVFIKRASNFDPTPLLVTE